ncbi:MAG: amino acid ABC transporter permease [Clostridiales Family XIII bacterium]|jgi:polar amino acid transport system permease protein|nr:amino acid ABC transporter permease [Clostridiales Family XIII bacterium]
MAFNWDFIIKFLPNYGMATLLTIRLAAFGILLSVLLGVSCSLVLYFRVRVVGAIVRGYIELSRNTPLLIQLFFLYYGIPKLGILISSHACAIIGLTFLGGGYMAEAFRSGLESVSKAQLESGLSIGLNSFQMTRFVIFPQALSVAVPALGANCIFLIKETSVMSIIAIQDLMSLTKELIGMYYNTVETLTILVICYLLLLLPVSFLFLFIERRLRYAEFGL